MKVEVKRITSWNDALNAARFTRRKEPIDKEPSDKFKADIIIAEHSPLRCVLYNIDLYNIPYYVSVHLVRHVHAQPFVSSSRPDIDGNMKPRNEQKKDDPVNMRLFVNAQEIINISKVRLCNKAEDITRKVWIQVINKLKDIDPILAKACVPSCIYRGFCPEINPCGFAHTPTWVDKTREYINIKSEIQNKTNKVITQKDRGTTMKDNEKKIDIPFGAFDSELYYQKINIPDGFEAIIKDSKIILKRKENEDERMVKFIKNQLFNIKKTITENYELDAKLTKAIDWLEKQGEQKLVDKVEPKFHLKDWIIYGKYSLWRVINIDEIYYTLEAQNGNVATDYIDYVNNKFHLWTIQDAKDGDVLVNYNNKPYIYNGNIGFCSAGAHCGITLSDTFVVTKPPYEWSSIKGVQPATKKQRDELFAKIKEAGYEWDAEKKELKRVSEV